MLPRTAAEESRRHGAMLRRRLFILSIIEGRCSAHERTTLSRRRAPLVPFHRQKRRRTVTGPARIGVQTTKARRANDDVVAVLGRVVRRRSEVAARWLGPWR